MNKALVTIIAFWILFFGALVGMHENRLRHGEEVILQTVPVDPRDFFRGDYVILRYDISRLELKEFNKDEDDFYVGQRLYLTLEKDSAGVSQAKSIETERPSNGSFIAGKVNYVDTYQGSFLRMEYGIESYFVPEGTGKEIEKQVGITKIKVRIDKKGNAAIEEILLEDLPEPTKDITPAVPSRL